MENEFSDFDLQMTARALTIAAQGVGQVSPSPLVGCVIADANNEVVGEGAYIYENVTHAEVIALNQAGEKARNGTAYVSLEPHDHVGRTPPCTTALIRAGIRRVVCPIEDPNPLVSGNGFRTLRRAGIEVATGILKPQAARLNEKFCHWHKTGRPFVHLKMALSLDGRIATKTGDSRGITNTDSNKRVHDLRHEYDAILIGANTAQIDDPLLTDRSGKKRRRPLLRVILDNSLHTSPATQLARTATEIPTLIFTDNQDSEKIAALEAKHIQVKQIDRGGRNLPGVLSELKRRDVQSIFVEGGASVAGAFLDGGLIDKFSFFYAPIIIGGERAPTAINGDGAALIAGALKLENVETLKHGDDFEISGYPQNRL